MTSTSEPAHDSHGDAAEIRRRIAERSQLLADLYSHLNDLRESRSVLIRSLAQSASPQQYETLRRQLAASDPQVDELANEIRRATQDVSRLGEQLRTLEAPSTGIGERRASAKPQARGDLNDEQITLQRRLLEIADAQTAAVKEWNLKPTESEREAFEAKLSRLHEEFDAVLQRLKRLQSAPGP